MSKKKKKVAPTDYGTIAPGGGDAQPASVSREPLLPRRSESPIPPAGPTPHAVSMPQADSKMTQSQCNALFKRALTKTWDAIKRGVQATKRVAKGVIAGAEKAGLDKKNITLPFALYFIGTIMGQRQEDAAGKIEGNPFLHTKVVNTGLAYMPSTLANEAIFCGLRLMVESGHYVCENGVSQTCKDIADLLSKMCSKKEIKALLKDADFPMLTLFVMFLTSLPISSIQHGMHPMGGTDLQAFVETGVAYMAFNVSESIAKFFTRSEAKPAVAATVAASSVAQAESYDALDDGDDKAMLIFPVQQPKRGHIHVAQSVADSKVGDAPPISRSQHAPHAAASAAVHQPSKTSLAPPPSMAAGRSSDSESEDKIDNDIVDSLKAAVATPPKKQKAPKPASPAPSSGVTGIPASNNPFSFLHAIGDTLGPGMSASITVSRNRPNEKSGSVAAEPQAVEGGNQKQPKKQHRNRKG